MKSASRPALRRLFTLDRMIRDQTFPNATTVARELEVHPRTIHRDIEFLRDSWRAPLQYCPKRRGYYYRGDYALPHMRLTEGEVVALFLAERLMQLYKGTPYAELLGALFEKITASLPDEMTIDLQHLSDVYSVRHLPTQLNEAKHFASLAKAVQNGRQLQLKYWSAWRDETAQRIVDPYHLMSMQGDWYLIGYCHLREDIRMFAPSRIRSFAETGETFQRPADFRIQEFMDHSFRAFRGDGKPQRVQLRFSPGAARYVREKQWHPSQSIVAQKDGSLILTMHVSHLLEVKQWAMSYGSECEVLEPQTLRKEIKDEIAVMCGVYS